MNCECQNCKGDGVVTCWDCDGKGTEWVPILEADIPKTHPKFNEVKALKDDARKAKRDFEVLSGLNPASFHSYQEQLKKTMDEIERQAEELEKRK